MHYITTAIDYTNGEPHIGHAYEKLLADVLIKLSSLVFHFPEILEIDLNPLIAGKDRIACVDVRIAI